MDGLTQRRPWWNAEPSQPIDSISGTPIKLPKSLGGTRIKHSGLYNQPDGAFKPFTDSNGNAPWEQTIAEIRTSLKSLSTSDRGSVITRFIGQSAYEPPMTKALLDNHLFATTSDDWNHRHTLLGCNELPCPSMAN